MKIATGLASLALLILGFGVGWLLNALAIVEPINWIWVTLLSVAGLLVLGVGGWNKLTVVVGPSLLAGAGMSVLYELGRLPEKVLGPSLLIAIGALLLLASLPAVPLPPWMRDGETPPSERDV